MPLLSSAVPQVLLCLAVRHPNPSRGLVMNLVARCRHPPSKKVPAVVAGDGGVEIRLINAVDEVLAAGLSRIGAHRCRVIVYSLPGSRSL